MVLRFVSTFVLAPCELVLGTCNLEKTRHVMQKKCANQKGKCKCKNTLPKKMQITNARKMPAQKRSLHILHVFSFLGIFFRNHVCPVSPVLFFPLWQFIIFNDETRARVSDKHVLYTVPLHTFVVITRKTQVSEWALGLQRGRLFIFIGCLVVYIFLFFASSELKDAAKLFQTKKAGETSDSPALAKRTLDCTKRGKNRAYSSCRSD